MSEEHARELMVKHFPRCPLCRSEADYIVSPSGIVVQCKACKAKFFSSDLGNAKESLIQLSLFSVPSALVDESLIPILESMKNETFPVSFWQDLRLEKAELEQSLNYYRKRRLKDVIAARAHALSLPYPVKCHSCGEETQFGEATFRIGGVRGICYLLPFGGLGELQEELLVLFTYICPKCGRVEFFADEKAKKVLLSG